MHDYAKSITEPLLNLILLFCEKTPCFYHKIPSRFNANHIDKSQIKCACAAMQACADFHYTPLTSHVQGAEAPGTGLTRADIYTYKHTTHLKSDILNTEDILIFTCNSFACGFRLP